MRDVLRQAQPLVAEIAPFWSPRGGGRQLKFAAAGQNDWLALSRRKRLSSTRWCPGWRVGRILVLAMILSGALVARH